MARQNDVTRNKVVARFGEGIRRCNKAALIEQGVHSNRGLAGELRETLLKVHADSQATST